MPSSSAGKESFITLCGFEQAKQEKSLNDVVLKKQSRKKVLMMESLINNIILPPPPVK